MDGGSFFNTYLDRFLLHKKTQKERCFCAVTARAGRVTKRHSSGPAEQEPARRRRRGRAAACEERRIGDCKIGAGQGKHPCGS